MGELEIMDGLIQLRETIMARPPLDYYDVNWQQILAPGREGGVS